jgi:hypothetical protein
MVKVKVVYMNGKETEYDVDYPKAYIAKIMDSENDLMPERKAVKEIYASSKLIAEFIGSELRLVEPKPKKTAGMGRYKGHTVPAGCDVGQYAVDEALKIAKDLKDKITAEEDWNEYQAEILYAQKMIKENIWVMDHTGGDIEITYS